MIFACLEHADRYLALHSDFSAAIAFLRSQPLPNLPEGRVEIAGTTYALVFRSPTRQRCEARLEAHRKYIDIQYVISGIEEMGWRARSHCQQLHGEYDAKQDIEFFADTPDGYITVHPGEFVIFFPENAHAPLIGTGEIHKVVIKVPI